MFENVTARGNVCAFIDCTSLASHFHPGFVPSVVQFIKNKQKLREVAKIKTKAKCI